MLKYWRNFYRFLIFWGLSYLTPLLFLSLSVGAVTGLNYLSAAAGLTDIIGKGAAEIFELAGGFITGGLLTRLVLRFIGRQKERLKQYHDRINEDEIRRREEEKTAVVSRCRQWRITQ